ncbi:MAG: Ig-like domain-containing protein [Blautia sp.]|nr:Ig-like domain-containing protein [Blautia sp.]
MKKKRTWLFLIAIFIFLFALPVKAGAAVKLNKTSLTLNVKKTATLKVTGTTQKASWSSSNKKIATVSQKGVVKGVKKGSCVITAKVGSKKYTCKVKVRQPVTAVRVYTTSFTIPTGASLELKAEITPATASIRTVTWKSSNTKVATVSTTGLVRGISAGTATITATARDGSKKAGSFKVTVVNSGSTANITTEQLKDLLSDVEETFYINVVDGGGARRGFSRGRRGMSGVTWSSSAPSVLKVETTGNITPVSGGKATVSVSSISDPSVKASKTVSVVDMKNNYKYVAVTKDNFDELFGIGSGTVITDSYTDFWGNTTTNKRKAYSFIDRQIAKGWVLYGSKDFGIELQMELTFNGDKEHIEKYFRTLTGVMDFVSGISAPVDSVLKNVSVSRVKGELIYIKKAAVTSDIVPDVRINNREDLHLYYTIDGMNSVALLK